MTETNDIPKAAFLVAAGACQNNHNILNGIRAERDKAWRDNGWEAVRETYLLLRDRTPHGKVPAAWMAETHPAETAAYAAVAAYEQRYSELRDIGLDRMAELLESALVRLAHLAARDAYAILESDPALKHGDIRDSVFVDAEALRHEHLDKGHVRFDPKGVFTQAYYNAMAHSLGLSPLHGQTLFNTVDAASAPEAAPAPSR